MQKIYLSEEKHAHRMRLYKQGLTDSEMADVCGVTYQSIRYWRKKQGLKPNAQKHINFTQILGMGSKEIDGRIKEFTKGKADNQNWLSPQEFIKAWQGGFKYSGNCESQKKVGWWA